MGLCRVLVDGSGDQWYGVRRSVVWLDLMGVCLTTQSVYFLTSGWEDYLSTSRVGVTSVSLLSRSIL